jgi:hypothetical protein
VSATSPESLSGIEEYDPLQHAHLVVRGKVLEVSVERIHMSDWDMADVGMEESMMTVTKVRFAVTSVLRGNLSKHEIDFGANGGFANLFEKGHEYIVCAKWRRIKGDGLYMVGPYLGIYRRDDLNWRRIGEEMRSKGGESLTDQQLISRVEAGSMSATALLADVIARGRIIRTWQSDYVGENGLVGELVHYALEVKELLRGEAASGKIEFIVARVSAYTPPWYRVVTRDIGVGEEWYVFLQRGERGLYPFAGPNSLLRVEGDTLIYDNAVVYPMGAKAFDEMIRSEVSHDP